MKESTDRPSWLCFPRHPPLWARAVRSLEADLSHDADHLRRVYRWASRLAGDAQVSADLAGAAALLHDLVAVPKESASRAEASQRSAAAAPVLLQGAGYSEGESSQIVEAIRTCSFSRGLPPGGPLGALLQDADRLDAIGAIGVARSFACAQAMVGRGRALRLLDPDDPLASRRAPDESRFALDHFAVKLLRLAAGMHLPAARAEAARRHALMLRFVEELAREAGDPSSRDSSP